MDWNGVVSIPSRQSAPRRKCAPITSVVVTTTRVMKARITECKVREVGEPTGAPDR